MNEAMAKQSYLNAGRSQRADRVTVTDAYDAPDIMEGWFESGDTAAY